MKNKGHACEAWYVLLRSPCDFRLSEVYSGKTYANSANLKRHERKEHST